MVYEYDMKRNEIFADVTALTLQFIDYNSNIWIENVPNVSVKIYCWLSSARGCWGGGGVYNEAGRGRTYTRPPHPRWRGRVMKLSWCHDVMSVTCRVSWHDRHDEPAALRPPVPPPGGGGGLQEGGAAEGGGGGVEGGGEDAEVHHVPAEADEEPHTHRPLSQVENYVCFCLFSGREGVNQK